MRLTRIHHPQPLAEGQETALEESASTHVLRVLRLRPGAVLRLFDGSGNEYEAVLAGNAGGRARVRIGGRQTPGALESPLAVTLAQGISRGERMDLTLQKSVELGCGASYRWSPPIPRSASAGSGWSAGIGTGRV